MRNLKVLTDESIVGDWCDQNGNRLSEREKSIFRTFMHNYVPAEGKTTVYRGTSDVSMYNVEIDKLGDLSERLFMLGNKSVHCLTRDNIFRLDDPSDAVFKEIFERLSRISSYSSENRREVIRDFLKRNIDIQNFFSKGENVDLFLEKINRLENPKKKRFVKDYYVALLHAFEIEKFPACYMVSTSKDFNVALKFSKGRESDSVKGGIIIIAWVPKSNEEDYIKSIDLNSAKDKVSQLELPVYTTSPYPNEKEICIKAAIFPHFILGYIQTKKNIFVVNPYLMHQINKGYKVKSLLKDGITINQESFNSILEQTKYRSSVSESNGEYTVLEKSIRG